MDETIEQNAQEFYHRYGLKEKAKMFSTSMVPVIILDAAKGGGGLGFLVGTAAAFLIAKEGEGIYAQVREVLSSLPSFNGANQKRTANGERTWGQRMMGFHPSLEENAVEGEVIETSPDASVNPVFIQPEPISNVIGLRRITIEEMTKHTTFNSYEVWLGRSLTDKKSNRAVKINFFKRHIKIIGASQHGKSSLAAALIEAIASTHDNEHVLFALLDLENKTSRLFADLPHIAEITVGDQAIPLHARSYDEVLERLELICAMIDYRYTLSEQELDEQPILIVYLEEFIDLKDHFKQLVNSVPAEQKEVALQKYTRLVYCIKKIAARGLKAYVQLLMCAQVDYADEDLKEALANVTSGMSFAVRPTAARAAGFYQNALLQKNAEEDQVGQFVVEMPEVKDIVLAPDYDLKARLRALAEREKATRKVASMNIPYSASHPLPTLNQGGNGLNRMNAEYPVNVLQKPSEYIQNIQNIPEYSSPSENILRTFTQAQEAQILNAYAEMVKKLEPGEKVTRTGLRDHLRWGNGEYTVLKAVCDKHHIG